MEHQELRQIIYDSDAGEWLRAQSVPGLIVGAQLSSWTDGDGELRLEIKTHDELAAYAHEVSLALAWGLDQREGEPWEGVWTSWASGFPDQTVRGSFADVLWCGVPVIRKLGVSVDGGRAALPAPLPIREDEGDPDSDIDRWEVGGFEADLFRLVDGIFYGGEYERYFNQAGFEVS